MTPEIRLFTLKFLMMLDSLLVRLLLMSGEPLIRRKLRVRSSTALDGQHCLAKGNLVESRISRNQMESLR